METTLFFSSLSVLLIQLYKWLVAKFGRDTTMYAIYIASFVLSLAYAVLTKENILTKETLAWVASIMLTTEGIYQLILKNLLNLLFPTTNVALTSPQESSGSGSSSIPGGNG